MLRSLCLSLPYSLWLQIWRRTCNNTEDLPCFRFCVVGQTFGSSWLSYFHFIWGSSVLCHKGEFFDNWWGSSFLHINQFWLLAQNMWKFIVFFDLTGINILMKSFSFSLLNCFADKNFMWWFASSRETRL